MRLYRCPACGSQSYTRNGSPRKFDLLTCKSCGTVYTKVDGGRARLGLPVVDAYKKKGALAGKSAKTSPVADTKVVARFNKDGTYTLRLPFSVQDDLIWICRLARERGFNTTSATAILTALDKTRDDIFNTIF